MGPDPEQQQADSHSDRTQSDKLYTNTSDGKIEKLLLRIPKMLASGKELLLSFVAVLVVGLLWIFSPVIDGATEIFLPGSGSYIIEFFAVAAFVLLLHIACFVVAAAYKRSLRYLIYMLIPAGLIYVADHVLRPADMTWTDRRVDSFQLGARYRVNWAGGATNVRQEALALLINTVHNVSPPKSEWPESIRELRASAVKINKDARLVDVEIPRRRCFFWGDQFGYLITDANAAEPVIVNDPPVIRGHNIWKIADGIYLYETWP